MELGELISKSYLTCTSHRDGGGTVDLNFQNLEDAQACHNLLVAIAEQWFEKNIQNLRPK